MKLTKASVPWDAVDVFPRHTVLTTQSVRTQGSVDISQAVDCHPVDCTGWQHFESQQWQRRSCHWQHRTSLRGTHLVSSSRQISPCLLAPASIHCPARWKCRTQRWRTLQTMTDR